MWSAFIFYNVLIIVVVVSTITRANYNNAFSLLQIFASLVLALEILIGIGYLCVTYLP